MLSDPPAPLGDRPICVLGGTGFIGRALGGKLIEQGYEVISVGRRTSPAQPGLTSVSMDLSTAAPDEIASMLESTNAGAVINAAGGMWGLTEQQMVDVNTVLVDKLIEAVAKAPGRPKLVHLGTIHEYGLAPMGVTMTEKTPPAPVMAYGELKLRCTEAVAKAAANGQIDGVTLRIGNVIGERQPATSLLGVVAKQLADGATELKMGSLASIRDFIGLDTTCVAIDAVINSGVHRGEVINIGRGAGAAAREMVELLVSVSGTDARISEAVADQPETTWQCMETSLAKELIGWSPELDLTTDMERLWRSYAEVSIND